MRRRGAGELRVSPTGHPRGCGLAHSNGQSTPRRMEVVAWLGTAGNVAGGEAGGGGFPVSGEQGATGHGESSRRARWATRNPRSTMRRSAACEGDHGHGAELVGGEVLRASYGNGATGVGKLGRERGKKRRLTVLLQMCSSLLEEGSVRRNRRRSSSEKRRKTAT